eukprot:2946468-Rhodomonas_salina.1
MKRPPALATPADDESNVTPSVQKVCLPQNGERKENEKGMRKEEEDETEEVKIQEGRRRGRWRKGERSWCISLRREMVGLANRTMCRQVSGTTSSDAESEKGIRVQVERREGRWAAEEREREGFREPQMKGGGRRTRKGVRARVF